MILCMEKVRELSLFYDTIRNDHRIGPTHISLFMAIFQLYNLNGFINPVYTSRALLMEISKINGVATYHKCIKGLVDSGYIQYQPSYTAKVGSKIFIKLLS